MSDKFPYGQDLSNPMGWLGRPDTKSQRYLVAYLGGNPLGPVYDKHMIGFFGLESLSIGIFAFHSIGLQGGIKGGKLVKWLSNKSGELIDKAQDIVDSGRNQVSQNQIQRTESAEELYRMIADNATLVEARVPFSMNDLAGKKGSILGFNVEFIGSASFYFISGGPTYAGEYFRNQQIFNTGTGIVGLGGAIADGWWDAQKIVSAYYLPGNEAKTEDMRPYQNYAVPAYFQSLPPPPYRPSAHIIGLGERYAAGMGRY